MAMTLLVLPTKDESVCWNKPKSISSSKLPYHNQPHNEIISR